MSHPIQLPADHDSTGRDLGSEELELLREVIESGTLNCTRGKQVNVFEDAFASRFGVAHARAVTSGTAAIHVAVAAIDPEPGDEIITTPITDMGAITPILFQQAIPIFADVDPVTLNITPESVEAKITDRTRAIIATHLFGNPCDVIGIKKVADRYGIPIIEDCAQAFLAEQEGRLVGTVGAIGAFSLQQGKHMTTGEGGVVITNDAAYARHMRLFSDKGWGYGDEDPDHYFLALNYRMTDLQGAVARAQLAKLDEIVARRRAAAGRLTDALRGARGLVLPEPRRGATHVYWKYPLIVDADLVRGGADALAAELNRQGVQCAPRYIKKPAFKCRIFSERKTYGTSGWPFTSRERDGGERVEYHESDCPGTTQGLASVVVLPCNEHFTDEHVDHIATAVRQAIAALERLSEGEGYGVASPAPSPPPASDLVTARTDAVATTRARPAAHADASVAPRVDLFGVPVTNVDKRAAISMLDGWLQQPVRKARSVFIVNAHTLNLACADVSYHDVLRSGSVVFGDGTGVRLAARMKGLTMVDNLVGTDLVPEFISATLEREYRYFLLGGGPGVVVAAARTLAAEIPGVVIAGHRHGYVGEGELAGVISAIRETRPDVLLVGMGNPLQECWIHANLEALDVPLAIGVGGLFDHWAGNLTRAPEWVRRLGIEWTQILMQQPQKWRRYVVGNPVFLYRGVRESWREGGGRRG